jgi:hypothetical protein
MKPGEVWEPIAGFKGRYFISNLGRVGILKRYKFKGKYNSNVISPKALYYDEYGNTFVYLTMPNGKRAKRAIRWLVATAFMGARPGDKITHIDGDLYNCAVNNLKLASSGKKRWTKHMIDYCWISHYEYGVPYLKLAERFRVSVEAIRQLMCYRRKEIQDGRSNTVEEG